MDHLRKAALLCLLSMSFHSSALAQVRHLDLASTPRRWKYQTFRRLHHVP